MNTTALQNTLKNAAANGRLVITGHDDPDVDSLAGCVLLHALCAYWHIAAQIVLPTRADGQTRRILPQFGIDPDAFRGKILPSDSVVLVDHHRPLHLCVVAACIDHHPTDFPPAYPYTQIEPSGACTLMILRLMEKAGMPVTDVQRKMAVTALYLDTIALRSVKIPAEEAAWGEREAARLGLDTDWLLREGMRLRDMTLPARTLAMLGKKMYDYGGKRVLSTYVQTDAMTKEKLSEILTVLHEERVREHASLWVFLVHDPVHGCTDRYDLCSDGRTEAVHYTVLASRGKTVMPEIERKMLQEGVQGDA